MECFHHAVIGIQRHDYSIFRISTGDHRYITISHYLIDDLLQLISCIGKINNSYDFLRLVLYIVHV